jgi:hypothetical protein
MRIEEHYRGGEICRRLSNYAHAIQRRLSRRTWKQFTSVQTLNEPTILEVQIAGCEVVSRKELSMLLLDIWVN